MDEKIINWLTDSQAWLKYALDKQADPSSAINHHDIQTLLKVIKSDDNGLSAILKGSISYKNELFWYLFFLADIGFSAEDLDLEDHFEKILELESNEHKFILSKEMKPDYFCISSILFSSMVKMSKNIKDKLHPHISVIMDAKRLDGGWHCAKSRAVGKKFQNTESCPMDNINVLMLLGQYEQYISDERLNGAVDLLLNHWDKRDEKHRPYGFGIGTQFKKLKYPNKLYGILQVLDVLSLYPYARAQKSYKEMLEFVKQKAIDGKYYAESVVKIFDGFDFAQKKTPSRWITFIIKRIEQRDCNV